MMPVQEDGMNIDPQILIQTQSNFISQARVREVQLEAAIQQLIGEKQQLQAQLDALTETQEDEANDLEVQGG